MHEMLSRNFEAKLQGITAEHYANLGMFLRENKTHEAIDDRKATLILMWYIRTFIMLAWKGSKVSDVLENIRKVVIEQDEK